MDFDFPAMDEMASSNHTTQPPSVHNLLNTNPPTPISSQPLPWSTDLPSIHLSDSRPPLSLQPAPALAKRHLSDLNSPTPVHLDDSPPIEIDVVNQMGGLPYADLCKERAREKFKEMKKNEHYANGDLDRMKRRKKGDTSMTPRQKYLRRLRMNQDSAAAARHAQEVYVHVLEKLVKTAEEEKKSLAMELNQVRQQNNMLHGRVQQLEEPPQHDTRHFDAIQVAKLVDMLTTPEPVSAHEQDPNLARSGIQLTPAM